MMLQSLDIDYEVLEASDRVGGRLYTYNFSKKEHDYFDVGAMRFPDTPMMKRTFHLFKKLTEEANLSLIDYIFESPNSTLLYNGKIMKRASSTQDPTAWDVRNIPSQYAQEGWSALVNNVVDPFVKQLAEDIKRDDKKGWKLMMEYDQYSTRAYMSANRSDTRPELDELRLMPYPTPVVDWLEMFDKSSGWYDHALSETVLETLAFNFPPSGGNEEKQVEWRCIDGGSQVIAEKMNGLLTKPHAVKKSHRVTAIALKGFDPDEDGGSDQAQVELTFADGKVAPRSYGHVISTVPLPCLRTMDLSRASLTAEHDTALRELRYGPAIKIGVKFKTSWWTDAGTMKTYQKPEYQYGAIVGGQSYSDRMVRTVVYPSYGEGKGEKSTVLMVSYCWTEDANRWSALFGDASEEQVKDIVLRDLVAVHGFLPDEGYTFLKDQWVDSYKYSWAVHPESMGAYGMFGPGQFSYAYTHLTQPAAVGRLHFAGEALSTRHAWVVGALDASWRAVYEILQTSYPDKVVKFKELWGSSEDWTDKLVYDHVCFSLLSQGLRDVEHKK
ncbi:FAD/NAD-binding domain-containing protein [Rhodofomes roseus]|uniref:FAD/NAD-binding domain-containing protein n=1 Tax=Rhodofomes roseus TaxID=34475 RepID=A0ABQ8KCH0_9APHY|nr:FAD/NAD-binding domain-containing protein [Rhodofomes roseus]KAH9835191.1 FAD/NAD-binding domain-containing protein [Rhodofomes roseus]